MYTDEEFDNFKQKVLKYIFYKKRTEQEVRTKFQEIENDMLEDMLEFLKEQKYIDDENYLQKSVNEFMALKNMSQKEIKYKLYQKGISKDLIEDFFNCNSDTLFEYEVKSAKNIFIKKSKDMDEQNIIDFLYKKGYTTEAINYMLDNLQ